jgi:hypothetical protein
MSGSGGISEGKIPTNFEVLGTGQSLIAHSDTVELDHDQSRHATTPESTEKPAPMQPPAIAPLSTNDNITSSPQQPAPRPMAVSTSDAETQTLPQEPNATALLKAEHQARLNDEIGDQIQNTIFDIEASFGAAIHHMHLIPAQRLPTMIRYDGSPYDPNPPDVLYPKEVVERLTAIANEAGGILASLATRVTGKEHVQYNIPEKLVNAAMTRKDGKTFSEKVRLQYQQEYERDPAMQHLIQNDKNALRIDMGPPPPHRTAVNPTKGLAALKEGDGEQAKPSPKAEQMKKTPKKTAEQKAVAKQKYRASPRNGVYIFLEATETDIARTHKTPDGRKLWAAKGIFWPPSTIFEGNSSLVPQGFAKYCKNAHAPWMVLVSGDVGNCNECDHQDFVHVDIYLPPQTRAYFLRRHCAVNEDGELCETSIYPGELSLLPQPNSLAGLRIMSDPSFWSMGQTFERGTIQTPPHILRAYGTTEIDKILSKISKSNTDRWLRTKSNSTKPVLTPRFETGTRKLENGGSLKTAMQHNDETGDFQETKKFHIQRLKHVWDFSDISEKAFDTLVGNMVKKVQDYYKNRLLTPSQFDIDCHWFTRKDADEYLRAGVLSELLLLVTGKSDPTIKKSTAKGRSKKEAIDPDIEEYEKRTSHITADSPSPPPEYSHRRRKSTTTAIASEETDFLGRRKRIKVEDKNKNAEDNVESWNTATFDEDGGAPDFPGVDDLYSNC